MVKADAVFVKAGAPEPGLTNQQLVDLGAVQRRWVRANEDWRSGRLDMAQVRRIESVRASVV